MLNKIYSHILVKFIAIAFMSSVATTAISQDDSETETASVYKKNGEIIADFATVLLIDNVQLSAREAGFIEKLNVKVGDKISADEIVANLDSKLFELELAVAKGEAAVQRQKASDDYSLQYAEKSAEVSDAVLKRSKEAYNKFQRAVSKTDLDRLRLEHQRDILSREKALSDQRVASLEADLKQESAKIAQIRLDLRALKTPISGTVVELLVQNGERVEAAQPVARIINLETFRVEAKIPAEMIDATMIGKEAKFTVTSPKSQEGQTFTGKVSFVSPEIDPISQEVIVWTEINNKDGKLRPGSIGNLSISAK